MANLIINSHDLANDFHYLNHDGYSDIYDDLAMKFLNKHGKKTVYHIIDTAQGEKVDNSSFINEAALLNSLSDSISIYFLGNSTFTARALSHYGYADKTHQHSTKPLFPAELSGEGPTETGLFVVHGLEMNDNNLLYDVVKDPKDFLHWLNNHIGY